jgi:triosephosphate isomerase (TIM)
VILGNWKMHTTRESALTLASAMRDLATQSDVPVGICPPAVWLDPICQTLRDSRLWVGAQDCVGDGFGAHTGCVNAAMLADVGCQFVLLGHSERRARFAEHTDGLLPAVAAVLETGMFPVLCVGESLAERQSGDAISVVESQVRPLLQAGLDLSGVVLAYEPVWAIGSGLTATPADIAEMHRAIRAVLGLDDAVVLYGGSVSPDSAAEIFSVPEVSGALVGGASLDVNKFAAVIAAWEQR